MIGSDIDRALEISKCAHDFVYFCETYLKLVDPVKGLIPFKLYSYQKRYAKVIGTCNRVIGKKFRQGGFTTVGMAWMLWKAMFCIHQDGKPWTGLYMVQSRAFSCIVFDFITHFPSWLKEDFKLAKSTDYLVEFEGRGKLMFRTPTSACGASTDFLFIDEAAFITDMDKHWKAIYPTTVGAKILIMSTPSFQEGWFYETYKAAFDKLNSFYVFYSCHTECPKYTADFVAECKKNMGLKGFKSEILCNFLLKDDLQKKWENGEDFSAEVSAAEEIMFLEEADKKREEAQRLKRQINELSDFRIMSPDEHMFNNVFGPEDGKGYGKLTFADDPEYTLSNDPEYKGQVVKSDVNEIKDILEMLTPSGSVYERKVKNSACPLFKCEDKKYNTLDNALHDMKEKWEKEAKLLKGTEGQVENPPGNKEDLTHYKAGVVFNDRRVEQMSADEIHQEFTSHHVGWSPEKDSHPEFDKFNIPFDTKGLLEIAHLVQDNDWVDEINRRLRETNKSIKYIEDRLNSGYGTADMFALSGIKVPPDSLWTRHDIMILYTVAQDPTLPEDMELEFIEGYLCVRGVPTNILERDCMDLYNGILAFKSSKEAADEVVTQLRKRLRTLFRKVEKDEHEHQDQIC